MDNFLSYVSNTRPCNINDLHSHVMLSIRSSDSNDGAILISLTLTIDYRHNESGKQTVGSLHKRSNVHGSPTVIGQNQDINPGRASVLCD